MLDTTRQNEVFQASSFNPRRVDIIGAGAIGSYVAYQLAKHAVTNIHVWDFDKVEEHNICNQLYGKNDIGKPKVEALRERILYDTHLEINTHNECVDGSQQFGTVVFLCVDSMSARKQIWQNGIKGKLGIKLMIETRIGPQFGEVYAIEPFSQTHQANWESTLCNDDEVMQVSACGGSVSVGATVVRAASDAVSQMINWYRRDQAIKQATPMHKVPQLKQKVIFDLSSMTTQSNSF